MDLNGIVRRRVRRAGKLTERQRRAALEVEYRLQRRLRRFRPEDSPWWADPEGGAGVREPRRPLPTAPAGALELDLPVDLTHLGLCSASRWTAATGCNASR